MRKLFALVAILSLGMASAAWAMDCPSVTSPTTRGACTQTVFNDAGSALTSGAVVVWDQGDTEFDRSGYPYVTTSTAADDDWPAGVILNDSCADQSLCTIVVWGWARTNVAASTDGGSIAADEALGTTTVAGQAGMAAGAAGTCFLGHLIENRNLDTGATATADLTPLPVFVRPFCED